MDHGLLLNIALVHVAAGLIVTAINIGMAQRRQWMSAKENNNRLRAALYVELTKIRELHEGNLARISRGDRRLLSSRALMPIFRGNAVRMHLLTESEIPDIMAAYLSIEHIEGLTSASCKASGHSSYLIQDGLTDVQELANAYARTQSEIDHGLARLRLYLPVEHHQPTASTRTSTPVHPMLPTAAVNAHLISF